MATNPVVPTLVLELETDMMAIQVTVRCSGRLVADTCQQLRGTVRRLIPTTKLLILDLSGVDYVDSSALGTIVGLCISSQRAGCDLKLINLSPRAKKLFSMTQLQEVLESRFDDETLRYTPD
jgi:anti-sigma B factor antagonist